MEITHSIRIRNGSVLKDNSPITADEVTHPDELYRHIGSVYPKYFKMDILCKWAWLAAECLLTLSDSSLYNGLDKSKIAVVLATSQGCIEVDKKYKETIATIPSPALFVYTLPNIMLGEICIRHGFKGEQACVVSEQFDSSELQFWVNDLLEKRGMEACLCGWIDITTNTQDILLLWVTGNNKNLVLSSAALQQLYNS